MPSSEISNDQVSAPIRLANAALVADLRQDERKGNYAKGHGSRSRNDPIR
jgi:hypothetical protein